MLLLFIAIEPSKKKTVSNSLLFVSTITHIQQYVWILPKEFFNDADNCSTNLRIIGRRYMTTIYNTKPIGWSFIKDFIRIKLDYVNNIIVGMEPIPTVLKTYTIR